jgi:hypothetical protein
MANRAMNQEDFGISALSRKLFMPKSIYGFRTMLPDGPVEDWMCSGDQRL